MDSGTVPDLSTFSLVKPPPGVESNFVDPESRGNAYQPIIISLTVLATLSVFVRLYTRIWITRSFGHDDWTCAVSMITCIPFVVVDYILIQDYLMHHAWDYPASALIPRFFQVNYATYLLATPVSTFNKISVFLLYIRIFDKTKWIRRSSWLIILFLALFNTSAFFAIAFQCSPVEKFFNPLLPGKCISRFTIGMVIGIQLAAVDLIAFILPIKEIMGLKVVLRKRIQLLVLFALALLTCVSSIIRVISFHEVEASGDSSWYGHTAAIWVVIESTLSIICSCAPIFPAFFRATFARIAIPETRVRLEHRNMSSSSQQSKDDTTQKSKEVVVTDSELA